MANLAHPNLFSYATSELSQDAFICWLAEWADPKYAEADPVLHQTGREFVLSMIRKVKPDYEASSLNMITVTKQAEKLDVLIEVNKESDNRLAILVEDKVHSNNFLGQLEKYYRAINEIFKYEDNQVVPILLKTGYQSRFSIPPTYKTYLRGEFLDVLRMGKDKGVVNAIYDDFLDRLTSMDLAIKQFSTNTGKWGDDDWRGFFLILYEHLSEDGANWGYVSNRSGGFWGFWWHSRSITFKFKIYKLYLQLEKQILRFRIEFANDAESHQKEEVRNIINYYFLEQRQVNSSLPKPRYTKIKADTKTVGLIKLNEYRVFDGNLFIDLDKTVKKLKEIEDVFDLVLAKLNLIDQPNTD